MLAAFASMFALTVALEPSAFDHTSTGFQLRNRIVFGRVAKYCSSAVSPVVFTAL